MLRNKRRIVQRPKGGNTDEPEGQKPDINARKRREPDWDRFECGATAGLQGRRNTVGWIDCAEQAVDDEPLVADTEIGKLATRAVRLSQGRCFGPRDEHERRRFRVGECREG